MMPKISLFQNISQVKNPDELDLISFLEDIRDGKYEDVVNKCRIILNKEERDEFKKTMPTATFSGTFSHRNDESLIIHSGILAVDLDKIENIQSVKRQLQNDRFVYSVFMSVSGTGLRVLFRIEESKHRDAFKAISKYLYDTYDLVCDPNGISPSKPYIVSFDPYLFFRMSFDEVPVFKKYIKETPVKKVFDFIHTTDDFERVINQICVKSVNICEDYHDWIKVGFAICDEFGESGRRYFHEISKFSPKYSFQRTDKQYDYFLKSNGSSKVNISTFYYFAKINGINIASEDTKTIIRTTKTGKKAGLSKKQIVDNLQKFSNITTTEDAVGKIYDSSTQEDVEMESILYQLEMFISNNYTLKMNEVTGYLEQGDKVLTPSDLNSVFVAAKKKIPSLDYGLLVRLLKSDFIEQYNPFFKFFGSDGVPVILPAIPLPVQKAYDSPLIDLLASTIENDNPSYTLFFVRKWIVSIISAAHKVHSPLLLCLLGSQNTGKTEWFRRLLPPELQAYYAESKLDKEKDDELLMTENLIIMDDELGGKSKQDNLKLKNLTSKQYFSLRRPYGDHNEKILRLAVLCGTSNTREVLSDPTGNRRIIPIEVNDIDKNLYNSIDKRALFMEAFRLYKEGFDWRITANDIKYLNTDQSRYEMVVAEKELILKYFQPGDSVSSDRLTTTEIKVEIERLTMQKLSLNIIGRELENCGFERKTTRDDGNSTLKKWMVERINRVDGDLERLMIRNRSDDSDLRKHSF